MSKSDKQAKVNITQKIGLVFGCVVILAYGIACTYLYYMQTQYTKGGEFESDLYAHIAMALDGWGYSVTAIVYRILSMLPASNLLIAIFLSVFTIGTIFLTAYVVKPYIQHSLSRGAIALACGVAMPFYIEAVQATRYIGYQSPSIWHNSTYIVMKLFATAALFLCFNIAQTYTKKISVGKCIAFAILLALATATKTSFVAVFAPAALLMLIGDGLTGVPIKKLLLVATTIIPTILVVLFQEAVLFGEDTGNGIVIEFGYTVFFRAETPQYTMILSALFPVLIFLFNIYDVIKDTIKDIKQKSKGLTHREFLVSWGMWFFGALELLFLKETGNRVKDANFAWGYNYCLFILFIISCIYLINNLKSKTFMRGNKALKVSYGVVMLSILTYHVYCGIYFFIRLLDGTTYFM
ncbi:MAG: hypothetical protein IJZ42_12035 [Lachnospiraceae bacterium]|nr:hypothetical protein [Lachnospiraceae bacterium]